MMQQLFDVTRQTDKQTTGIVWVVFSSSGLQWLESTKNVVVDQSYEILSEKLKCEKLSCPPSNFDTFDLRW